MSKVVGMLVALAAFCAMPAVAFAGGDNTSSGNTQNGTITQGASGGDSSASGGDGGSGGGSGGDASSGDGGDADDDGDVSGGGTGGGTESVTLAQTGFDAWVLALLGGLSLAGGLSLLVVQRRGRTDA